MKFLIMGLPGSGKTTLATELSKITGFKHLNADEVRKEFNDWDFSNDGRLRQALRMNELAKLHDNVIADFVCPTEEYRQAFSPDLLIYLDTIKESRFEDTNKIFAPPLNPHITIKTQDYELWSRRIQKHIKTGNIAWEETFPTIQFMGRWQPWHTSHRALFDQAFLKTGQVYIMVRTMPTEESNPFNFQTVKQNIIDDLDKRYAYGIDYKIVQVPNISKIVWGRTVGYEFEQISLTPEQESVSATMIRQQLKKDGKL